MTPVGRQQPATQPSGRGPLRWHAHKVRRLILTAPDLTRVVKELVGGGAWELKLYLWLLGSMHWVPGRGERDGSATVTQTYRALATSIDMPLPGAPGALTSHMHKIVGRLVDKKFAATERIPGRGLILHLLRVDGSGKSYLMPDPKGRGGKVYLDAEFFANGWHAILSKHALALLMVACIEETWQWGEFGKKGDRGGWRMGRDEIQRKYGLHHDAVDKGKKELAHYGLLFFEFDELNDDERFFTNAPPHTYHLDKKVWLKRPDDVPRYKITYTRDAILEGATTRWMRLRQPHFQLLQSGDRKVVPLPREGRA